MTAKAPSLPPLYHPTRHPHQHFVGLRGLHYHVQTWGDARLVRSGRPPLVLLHGWMDVGASFQFLVDALHVHEGFDRFIIAPDWRGFGLTESNLDVDTYWFPDYLADLDALVDALCPEGPIDLLGHSMGGNVVMAYAGVRPDRIRRLINLEGFGMPRTRPEQAPARLTRWLDELKTPQSLRDYDTVQDVAARMLGNDPLLTADKAAWLARHWAKHGADGRWQILGDPAHKRVNPVLYRVDETLECWKQITAPLLWVEGDRTDVKAWWGTHYTKEEFHERLSVVKKVRKATLSPSGHMLHHDQPQALAALLSDFLSH
jgi:pimeloyl-ACP methyl ester carboxylesterase